MERKLDKILKTSFFKSLHERICAGVEEHALNSLVSPDDESASDILGKFSTSPGKSKQFLWDILGCCLFGVFFGMTLYSPSVAPTL